MNKIHMIAAILTIASLTVGTYSTSAFAKSSNYSNGYRDGLGDCHMDQSSWAMNLASNAGHHSSEYLAGHDAGLAACNNQSTTTTAVSNQNSNNVDQNNRNQPQSQGATAAQHCFVLIGQCSGANVNQGQSVNN